MEQAQKLTISLANSEIRHHPTSYITVFMVVAGCEKPLTVAEIVQLTGVEQQAVYRAARVYNQSGLFAREPSRHGGWTVTATQRGRDLYNEITRPREQRGDDGGRN